MHPTVNKMRPHTILVPGKKYPETGIKNIYPITGTIEPHAKMRLVFFSRSTVVRMK